MSSAIKKAMKNENFFWHMVGITLNSIYPLFLIIFITRFNGISESGLFSFAFYFVSVLSIIATYGGRIYHVSDSNSKYNSNQYVSLRYVTSLIMFIVAFIMCIIGNYDLQKTLLIIILLLFRSLEAIADSYYGIMQNNNNLEGVGKSFVFKASISFILFIIFDILTRNTLFSSTAFIWSNLFVFIVYDQKIVNNYEKIVKKIDRTIIELLRRCFPIFVFAFLQLILLNITRYVVDIYFSDEIQGYFGILIAPAAIIALFAQFFIQPSIKDISTLHHNKKYAAFNTKVSNICWSLIMLGIIVSFVTYFFGSEILSAIYNLDLVPYKLHLTLIVIGGIASGIAFVYSTILTILRAFKSQIIIYITLCFFTSIVSLVMVSYYQLEGALYAFFISMFLESIVFGIAYTLKLKKLS